MGHFTHPGSLPTCTNWSMRRPLVIRHDHHTTEMEGLMNKKSEPDKLTIKRETLRVLTLAELRLVAGGGCRRTTLCN
jgi:hypothetical protein